VAGILQRLGFTDDRKRVKGQRLGIWTPPPALLTMAAERRAQEAEAMRVAEEARLRQMEAAKANRNRDDLDLA
jgi:hypothetical protein